MLIYFFDFLNKRINIKSLEFRILILSPDLQFIDLINIKNFDIKNPSRFIKNGDG